MSRLPAVLALCAAGALGSCTEWICECPPEADVASVDDAGTDDDGADDGSAEADLEVGTDDAADPDGTDDAADADGADDATL
ncbi:MAG: hypothetical protein JXB32_11995 [Deltaproteobacteria bacterium]|nr:hypothetical protein [Deltaproteobacteria bacterium]